MTQTPVTTQAAIVRALKLNAERHKREYDEANLKFKRAQQELFDRMREDDDTPSSFTHDGILYSTHETVYGQVQDEEEFLKWAEENAPEMFGPKPRKKLVNELVREQVNAGAELPPGLGFYVDQYVSQRGNG